MAAYPAAQAGRLGRSTGLYGAVLTISVDLSFTSVIFAEHIVPLWHPGEPQPTDMRALVPLGCLDRLRTSQSGADLLSGCLTLVGEYIYVSSTQGRTRDPAQPEPATPIEFFCV